MTTKPKFETPAPRILTKTEARELLRQGEVARKEIAARFDRMERIDPKTAAARAR